MSCTLGRHFLLLGQQRPQEASSCTAAAPLAAFAVPIETGSHNSTARAARPVRADDSLSARLKASLHLNVFFENQLPLMVASQMFHYWITDHQPPAAALS